MKVGTVILAVVAAAVAAAADIVPVHEWTCNTEDNPPQPHDLTVRRGENMIFRTRYRNLRTPMDLSSARHVVFLYTREDPATNSAYFGKTGTLANAAGGVTETAWEPADCPAQDFYFYEQLVIGPTSTLGRAFGRLTILPAVGDAPVQEGNPRTLTLLDWQTVIHQNPQYFPFTNLTASVTNAVAKINSREATTNWTAVATNSSWDGLVATLAPPGMLTITSALPIARIEYDASQGLGIALADEAQTGGTWFAQSHGTLYRADIRTFRIRALTESVPPPMEPAEYVTVSNIQVWTWVDASLVGITNDHAGIHVRVDDPEHELDAVNLRTLESRISGTGTTPAGWAQYDANGELNLGGGVNMAGKRLWLDNRYSLLADGGLYALSYDAAFVADSAGRFALQHNGTDLLTATASNTPLRVAGFAVTPQLVTLEVATNGVTSEPWVEVSTNLVAGTWTRIQSLSSWPVVTNGAYRLICVNAWPAAAFFRAMQQGTNGTRLVAAVPLEAGGGITLGGVHRDSWPAGGGGGGSFSNLQINGVDNTGAVRLANSPTATWRQTNDWWVIDAMGLGDGGMAAVWDADELGTNRLSYKINGVVVGYWDTNGLHMYQGTLELWEQDLDANVRLYNGSRTAPSLTFKGYPDDWGLYARGYGGYYVAGWSVAGTEIGILHGQGVKLMATNAWFDGRHRGDLSECTGYPEPIFEGWRTNMVFTYLTLSNLVVTPGSVEVRDVNGTARVKAQADGSVRQNNAAGIAETIHEPGATYYKSSLGSTGMKVEDTGLTFYEQASGQWITYLADYLALRTPAGIALALLDKWNGLKLWNEATPSYPSVDLNYRYFNLMNTSSNLVFFVDMINSRITQVDTSVTNSGSITFYGPNGTNLLTLTGSTGAIKVRGQDSDSRYMRSYTNYPDFVMTNAFGGITQVLWYADGQVTNRSLL